MEPSIWDTLCQTNNLLYRASQKKRLHKDSQQHPFKIKYCPLLNVREILRHSCYLTVKFDCYYAILVISNIQKWATSDLEGVLL